MVCMQPWIVCLATPQQFSQTLHILSHTGASCRFYLLLLSLGISWVFCFCYSLLHYFYFCCGGLEGELYSFLYFIEYILSFIIFAVHLFVLYPVTLFVQGNRRQLLIMNVFHLLESILRSIIVFVG